MGSDVRKAAIAPAAIEADRSGAISAAARAHPSISCRWSSCEPGSSTQSLRSRST